MFRRIAALLLSLLIMGYGVAAFAEDGGDPPAGGPGHGHHGGHHGGDHDGGDGGHGGGDGH